MFYMKTISVSVSEADYEVFQEAAMRDGRSVAHMIREAMAVYRAEQIEKRRPLLDLPVLIGHRLVAPLPSRAELYDEIHGADDEAAR